MSDTDIIGRIVEENHDENVLEKRSKTSITTVLSIARII